MRDFLSDPTPQVGDIINDPDSPFHGAEVIAAITRADAIHDGILIDITPYARAVGIKFPLAITETAYAAALRAPHVDRKPSDISIANFTAWLRCELIKNSTLAASEFTSPFLTIDGQAAVALKIHIGPGDTGEPVLTVMLPNED